MRAIPQMRTATESKKLLRASAQARQIERRLFLKQGLSLGALTLLTGCDVTDTSAVQGVLNGISRWNDRTQAAIFKLDRSMPTYPESQAVKDFRYNAYFGQNQIPKIDGDSYKLNLSGLVDSRRPWTLQDLYRFRRNRRSRATSASRAGA
jgi:DMSO/TMAO reductase YedYZ molybdopterin-dependent catalytic subunit